MNKFTSRSMYQIKSLVTGLMVLCALALLTGQPSAQAKSKKAKDVEIAALAKDEKSTDSELPAEKLKKISVSFRDGKTTDSEPPAEKLRTVSLSFKQMGAWSSLKLRGVDGSQVLQFPIRQDEVVVSAKLRIAYDYSPALIAEISHLKVILNDRIAAVEGLPYDKNVGNVREINLNPRHFQESNTLEFKLIGHYTRLCEDPYHSSLWLTLSDLGRLELTLAPIQTVADLKYLPSPFFDKRANSPLSVPFVFAKSASLGTIQAAGVVASWFGVQARNRAIQFPVKFNELPEGHSVVFLQGSETLQGLKASTTAGISLVPHPANPFAKILLVSGSNDAEVTKAAHAIALTSHALAGQSATVINEVEAAARKPYDAPAWLPLDRSIRFGEVLGPEQLRVHAYFPDAIRLNYRVPPDIFTWRTDGVPVNLKFRAIRLPPHHNSSLNVAINSSFLQAFAINEPIVKGVDTEKTVTGRFDASGIRQEQFYIPPYGTTGRDQLQLGYYFDVIREGDCRAFPPDNLEAAIDPESTIDFSQFPHYAALPNLAYFANLGFPFTRMADLSDTALAMPDTPTTDELSLYLTVMGRMGEATGYPSLRHTVVSHLNVDKYSGKDIIAIGSGSSQSLISKWKDHLPMVTSDSGRSLREVHSSWRPNYRWAQGDLTTKPTPPGSFHISAKASLAVMMGFESPMESGKSVVFLFADKTDDLAKIVDLITDLDRIPNVQGDFVVVDDKTINHARASDTYYIGTLPWLDKVRWFFADQPFLLAAIVAFACILLAMILYRPLKKIVALRRKAK